MKKVIAFSLWGDNPKYTIGLLKNLELASKIYPDWICRVYCANSVPVNIIRNILNFDNHELIVMNQEGNWEGMFWRFLAAEDTDIMLSRDTDSRISIREKLAVDEWLKSDKDFHIMRDHPAHATAILGGMWGCRNGILKNIRELINNYKKGNFWQVDQNFLREKIYPIIKNNSIVHDPFFEKKPFPSERENYEFVGDVFNEFDIRHPDYWKDLV